MRLQLAAALLLAAPITLQAQTATAWPEADKLFHYDPRWLGADAAYSVDLGKGRVLWIFEDTFLAAYPGSLKRSDGHFLHNTVAIQHGYNPAHATIDFHWRIEGNSPSEIFPNEGPVWIWPDDGIRLGNSLIVFGERVVSDGTSGFKSDGWNAYLIRNPDSNPSTWKPKKISEQHDAVTMASAILREGQYIYIFGESEPEHELYVARVSAAHLEQGTLDALAWWTGSNWSTNTSLRKPILHEGGTETSVQRDPTGIGFIEVNSRGFGATDIVMRHALEFTGPWSDALKIYRPPESDGPDPFVYAGKSHAELQGADLILTYATNSFTDAAMDDLTRYFPRFVRVTLTLGH